MEQLNIEGKRSGQGFVTSRERLIGALTRAQAPKVTVVNTELGRKGLLSYLRLLSGGMIKVAPASDVASVSQNGGKGLRVVCGASQSLIRDGAWVTEKMQTGDTCDISVSPHTSVAPNLGGNELAEAIGRVIPFAASPKDDRPVLKCIRFAIEGDKLTLTTADGYCLANMALDFEAGEGQALIPADEIKGMVGALKKAKRVKVAFEPNGHTLGGEYSLAIETEAIRYLWHGEAGSYPDYERVIPKESEARARFDTRELLRASMAVAQLSEGSEGAVRLYIGDNALRVTSSGMEAEATVEAETEGNGKIALNPAYLRQALKALGGMAEISVKSPSEACLFTTDGYRIAVMPMFVRWEGEIEPTAEATEATTEATEDTEPTAEVTESEEAEREAQEPAEAEAEPVGAGRGRRRNRG